MLAIAISLLFGVAGFAGLAVIRSAIVGGTRRARAILAELSEIERRAGVTRPSMAVPSPRAVALPALAAA